MPFVKKVRTKKSCESLYKNMTNEPSEKCKKVVPKKGLKCTKEGKSCSAGVIINKVKPVGKPRKTTKSDVCFTDRYYNEKTLFDYCKKCGDVIETQKASSSKSKTTGKNTPDDTLQLKSKKSDTDKSDRTISSKSLSKIKVVTQKSSGKIQVVSDVIQNDDVPIKKLPTVKNVGTCTTSSKSSQTSKKLQRIQHPIQQEKQGEIQQPIQQHYKNENFQLPSYSSQDINKFLQKTALLDPIKEVPEISTVVAKESESTDLESRPFENSKSDCTISPDDFDTLTKLREFRQDNYFECHSAESRIKNKVSATSLAGHDCVYKFYLNDRLFPVPLDTDHHMNIRCSECYLPLDLDKHNSPNANINGIIQAKVKLGADDEAKDMIVMLPVKKSLIVPQKRKEEKQKESLYYGVIKLDYNGNSLFSSTLPSDSLALKYQKGYKKHGVTPEDYQYAKLQKNDVIYI